jgi:serine/threonine protein kinase
VIRDGRTTIFLNVSYAYGEMLDSLSHLGALLENPERAIIKDQKKTKVVRTFLRYNDNSVQCYVKQYKAFSLRKKLEGTLLPSRISRAWRGAKILLDRGIRTAEPIAAIEMRRRGLLQESYYISKAIPEAQISVHYFGKAFASRNSDSLRQKRKFVRSLARFFRSLHCANIYHSDLKDYNIIVNATDSPDPFTFWLLDVECVGGFRGMESRRKLKNLVQINRTLGEKMKLTDRFAFLKEYLSAGANERLTEKQKKLIRKVFRRSRMSWPFGR